MLHNWIFIAFTVAISYALLIALYFGLYALFASIANKDRHFAKLNLLAPKRLLIHLSLFWLVSAAGAVAYVYYKDVNTQSVAECTDCHYREPTLDELEFAERTWHEAWGQMTDQELLDGVVFELEAYE